MAFDIDGAKKAGYSDEEIARHLAETNKFDYDGAVKAGYTPTEVIGHLASSSAAPQDKNLLQQAAELSSLPKRGLRGAAVTGENLINSAIDNKGAPTLMDLGNALNRGTEAIKPDYVAPKGEKLAAFAGDMADPRFYPLAGLKAAEGAGLAAKAGVTALQGGAAGAEASVLDQAEKKGAIDGKEVAKQGGIGAALGPLVTALLHAPGAIASGAKAASPAVASALGNLKTYLGKAVADNPEIMDRVGSSDAIDSGIDKIRDTVTNARKSAGENIQAEKEALGIAETFDQKANNRIKNGKQTLDQVLMDARNTLKKGAPAADVAPAEEVNAQGQKLLPAPKSPNTVAGPEGVSTKADSPVGNYNYKAAGEGPQFQATEGATSHPVNDAETIRRPKGELSSDIPEPGTPAAPQTREDYVKELYKLRSKLDDKINFDGGLMPSADKEDTKILKGYRAQINQALDSMPEATDLRAKDADFSNVMKLYDTLSNKFKDNEAGKGTLLDSLKNSGKIGTKAGIKATGLEPSLDKVNELAGQDVVGPVKQEYTKALINEAEHDPHTSMGILLKLLGGNPQNAAKAVAAVSKTANAVAPVTDALSKASAAVPNSLAAVLADKNRKK